MKRSFCLDSHDVGTAAAADIQDSWGDPTLSVGTEEVITAPRRWCWLSWGASGLAGGSCSWRCGHPAPLPVMVLPMALLGRVWWWAPARPCPAQLGGHLQSSFSPLPEGVSLHSARSLDTQKLNHCCTSCWWQQALGGFQGDKLYVQHWCWTLASVSRHAAGRLPPHASTTSLWWPSRPAFGNTKHCRSKGPNAFLMVVFSINSPCAVELNQTLISLWHI